MNDTDTEGPWEELKNTQYAPFPNDLAEMVERLRYKPGFNFHLSNIQRDGDHHSGQAGGLTLEIFITTTDAYHVGHKRSVVHYFPVPAATYDSRSWRRWLLDQCLKVDLHEGCEFFRFVDNDDEDNAERPYAPNHGPGRDPYTVFEYATDEDRRTSYLGEIKES